MNYLNMKWGRNAESFGSVSLTETSATSNTFTGTLLLSERLTAQSPSIVQESLLTKSGEILSTLAGDNLRLTYTDEFPYRVTQVHVALYQRARLKTLSPWIESGTNLTITIFDADVNQDAAVVEKIEKSSEVLWIQTQKPLPGDFEYLEAQETGVDTGIFTAVIRTSDIRSNVQVRFNSIIEPFDSGSYATVTYNDLAPRGDDVLLVRASTIGEIKVSPSKVGAGAFLTITVIDPDLDLDMNSTDTVRILATTSKGGEGYEEIILSETEWSTGVFTGHLKTRRSALLGPNQDGEVNVIDGDRLTVTYADTSPHDQTIYVCRDDSKTMMLRTKCFLGTPTCPCYNPRQAVANVGVFGRVLLNPGSTVTNSLKPGFSMGADTVLRIGPAMTVTIVDSDLNNLPASSEIYANDNTGLVNGAVSFAYVKGFSGLPLELSETAVNTHVFTASFFADDTPAASAGRVIVGAGAAASTLVNVEYQDPTGGTRIATARLQTNAEMTMSSEGSSSHVRVGDRITVTVSDGDRNQDFDHPEEISVVLSSHTENSVASESLILVETNHSSGKFTGTMRTNLESAREDSVLNCEYPFVLNAGGIRTEAKACSCSNIISCSQCSNPGLCTCVSAYVSAVYKDPSPVGITARAALALKFPATITLSATQTQAGQTMTVTVIDADLNTDETATQTASATFSTQHSSSATSSTFAQTSILLTEIGLASSSFTAIVQLCEGCTSSTTALNIGTQVVGIRRDVHVLYADSSHLMESCTETCNTRGQCSTWCSTVPAARGAQASVMTVGVLEVNQFTGTANVVHVTLFDLNADTSDLPESINVTATATLSGTAVSCGAVCQTTLELKETGLSTGAFTGSILTLRKAVGCTVSGPAICAEVGNDAVISFAYSDAQPAQTVTVTPKMVCDAILSHTTVAPGRPLSITVVDCDRDISTTSDQITVEIKSTTGSGIHLVTDIEQVNLTETASTSAFSATFTGHILTSPGGFRTASNTTLNASVVATGGNNILYIRTPLNATEPASSVSLSYADTFNSAGSSQTRSIEARACSGAVMNVSQLLRGTTGSLTSEGNVAFSTGVLDIEISDDLRNTNRQAVDLSEVTVVALDGSDHEVIEMKETGTNTSIFTGSIGVDAEASQFGFNDGTLGPLKSGDVVRMQYLNGCAAHNITVLATFVEPGFVTIQVPLVGLSIEDRSSIVVTVWDSDLNTDPLSVQSVGGLLTIASEESGDSQILTMTETAPNSRAFTAGVNVSSINVSPSASDLTLSCTGATACWVTATYLDANFAGISKRTRTQSRPLVWVTAASQTAQQGSMQGYSNPVFVAGEVLSVTVQDYVVDDTAPANVKDNNNRLMPSVSIVATSSQGDREVF